MRRDQNVVFFKKKTFFFVFTGPKHQKCEAGDGQRDGQVQGLLLRGIRVPRGPDQGHRNEWRAQCRRQFCQNRRRRRKTK